MKILKILSLVLITAILFSGCCEDGDCDGPLSGNRETEEKCGTIEVSETWKDLNNDIDYRITCDLVITANALVTIDPDVVIEVMDGVSITVTGQGVIDAQGTPNEPIFFQGTQEGVATWKFIEFNSSNPDNRFASVIIDGAGLKEGGSGIGTPGYAAMKIFGAFSMVDSDLRNSGEHGIYLAHVDGFDINIGEFENNSMRGCQGHPLWMPANYLTNFGEQLNTCFFDNNEDNTIGILATNTITEFIGPHNWFKASIPYLQYGFVYVNDYLFIQPGCEIIFDDGAGIGFSPDADGASWLRIGSTAGDRVVLSGKENIRNYWGGLWFETDNAQNHIINTSIINAGSSGSNSAVVLRLGTTTPESRIQFTDVSIQGSDCGVFRGTGSEITAGFTELTFTEVYSEYCY